MFPWWLSKVLRRRNQIISKFNSKYWRMAHKFGIHFPNNVKEELRFDKEAGNYYWGRELNKEISKVKVVWQRVDRVALE